MKKAAEEKKAVKQEEEKKAMKQKKRKQEEEEKEMPQKKRKQKKGVAHRLGVLFERSRQLRQCGQVVPDATLFVEQGNPNNVWVRLQALHRVPAAEWKRAEDKKAAEFKPVAGKSASAAEKKAW